jgi:hypothetical protein
MLKMKGETRCGMARLSSHASSHTSYPRNTVLYVQKQENQLPCTADIHLAFPRSRLEILSNDQIWNNIYKL